MTDTASTRDVNTAFADERAGQLDAAQQQHSDVDRRLADGTLITLGDGRYRVNDPTSWDHGEILHLQDGQILPQHGLDESTGRPALYTTTPAWHGLGAVIPGGTTDVDAVLKLGGIDFDVTRRPVLYQSARDSQTGTLAEHFVTVREDTGAGLGVVGSRYEVLQNRHLFEFLQDLVDDHDVVWESAGALREGRKVFVSLRLPQTVTIDAAGINDEIVPFVVAINSHDGSSQAHVVVTPWRPVCGNTERFALRDATSRWGVRHTRNARDRINEARRTLGLSVRYYETFAAEEEALARTDLAIAEFRHVIDDLWPAPEDDASTRTRNHHTNRINTLTGLWDTSTSRLGNTANAAERAITENTERNTPIRPTGSLRGKHLAARATAVLEGTADDIKNKAHRRLLTLTHR
jgi:phage/plasmid-like protein (TIGR03299 family)